MGRPRKYPKKENYKYTPKSIRKKTVKERAPRYSIFPSGGCWVLQDTRPEEPGYVFELLGQKMYAARIIAVASNQQELSILEKFVEEHNV